MDWDQGAVTYSDQQLVAGDGDGGGQVSKLSIRQRFREFIRNFRQGNNFVYRNQLLQRWRKRDFYLNVDLQDVLSYDPELNDLIQRSPNDYVPLFEQACKDALARLIVDLPTEEELPDMQVMLSSEQQPTGMRQLDASDVNRLMQVQGIITSASKTRAKATAITVRCRSCNSTKVLRCGSAFGGANIPKFCDAGAVAADGSAAGNDSDCGADPFQIDPDKSVYVDQQSLKLQESPESVPTGEMPRTMLASVDRYLVNKVAPGTRVVLIGVMSVFNMGGQRGGGAAGGGGRGGGAGPGGSTRMPYLRVMGIRVESTGSGRVSASFSPEEEEYFETLSRDPRIYDKLCKSISPSISGDYTVDIKKAIACLLFGGSRKALPDGMKLRGDINVLLLGDPSTAKSQFLKFVEKVAPVGVYTSGKGSSAAGLTASVIKDAKGEFVLEGGAMVLADGGVVCIDEFDKMREQDRVAIHEAMEQQTISVAKAGITTILNSRSSVLAAANPVDGRYDDYKSAAENIDFMPTILSRFDLIFIVRDIRDEAKDKRIARHVMGVHINASQTAGDVIEEGEIDIASMKKFISYCRNKCAPRLSDDAANALRNHYVTIRDAHRKRTEQQGGAAPTVPITVRQLEAVIRIAESLAKMQLCNEADVDHVNEAIRLFKVSERGRAGGRGQQGVRACARNDYELLVVDRTFFSLHTQTCWVSPLPSSPLFPLSLPPAPCSPLRCLR